MVADPTPTTLTNLLVLAQWCDLVLTEGTTTTRGEPRSPLRAAWRDLLGLEPPRLRVVTTELAGESSWRRQAVQRDSALPVVAFEPADRWVLMLDSDEFLSRDDVTALIQDEPPADPARLGLVPLYGAVDRIARSIHCCWKDDLSRLRDPMYRRSPAYVFAGPSLARAGAMRDISPSSVRFQSRLVSQTKTFGLHATMVESADRVAWKLANMRHDWVPRVLDERHLETMLGAGVHHAGWWIAEYREPEPWLRQLATDADMRLLGKPLPPNHLRALRAWAQARLDPLVPEMLVSAGDVYAAVRAPDAVDFLPALDEWQRQRPTEYWGHSADESDCRSGGGVHESCP